VLMSGSHRYPVSMPPAGMSGPYGGRPGVNPRGRALPIVVACGLAMGVFAGLLVVRGTGEGQPSPVAPAVASAAVPVSTAPTARAAAAQPASPAESSPAASAPPASEASPSKTPPASPAVAATAPQSAVAVVSFSVKPRRAHIFVNGEELAGTSADIPLTGGPATIQVVVRARGHKTYSKSYTVDRDQKIEISLHRERRDEGPGSLLDIR
jgi:hypothetical protein